MNLQPRIPFESPLMSPGAVEFHFNFTSNTAPTPCATELDHLLDLDVRTASALAPQLRLLQQNYPSWHRLYEDTPLESATSEELQHLLDRAPNGFATGLVLGTLRARLFLASVTGQAF